MSLCRGLKKKRMQAARRHKETARERKTMIRDGGGGGPSLRWDHLHRPLLLGDYAGTQRGAGTALGSAASGK